MPILPILIKISYYPFDNFCFRFFLYLCGEVRVLTDYYALHMDGFKNIDIRNFRGIEHLKIDDSVRVNVFLGQNMTGNGLRRYLSVVASAANTVNDIILVDEIDTGLHYSAYKNYGRAFSFLPQKQISRCLSRQTAKKPW